MTVVRTCVTDTPGMATPGAPSCRQTQTPTVGAVPFGVGTRRSSCRVTLKSIFQPRKCPFSVLFPLITERVRQNAPICWGEDGAGEGCRMWLGHLSIPMPRGSSVPCREWDGSTGGTSGAGSLLPEYPKEILEMGLR